MKNDFNRALLILLVFTCAANQKAYANCYDFLFRLSEFEQAEETNDVARSRQSQARSCGAACLDSALRSQGLSSPGESALANYFGPAGASQSAMIAAASAYGLRAGMEYNVSLERLEAFSRVGTTITVVWNAGRGLHYSNYVEQDASTITLMDPGTGTYRTLSKTEFLRKYTGQALGFKRK